MTENPVNGGFDDATGYLSFLAEFFPASNHGNPIANPNNWANMLVKYPDVAQLANIQCENCHGPQDNNAVPHQITVTDKTDNSVNKAAEKLLGYSAAEAIHKTCYDILEGSSGGSSRPR